MERLGHVSFDAKQLMTGFPPKWFPFLFPPSFFLLSVINSHRKNGNKKFLYGLALPTLDKVRSPALYSSQTRRYMGM